MHHHDKITIGDTVFKVKVKKSKCVPLDEFLKFLNYISVIQDDIKLYIGKNEICYAMKPGKIIPLTKIQFLLVVLGVLSRQSVYLPRNRLFAIAGSNGYVTLTKDEDDSIQREDGQIIFISDECFNVKCEKREYHFELLTRCGSMKYYTSDAFFSIYFHGKYYIYKILSNERDDDENDPNIQDGTEN